MNFYSTKNKSEKWSFRDAVIQGLAPDGGLFMPERIDPFPKEYFDALRQKSFSELSFDIAKQLLGDALPSDVLKGIVDRTVSFDAPVVKLEPAVWAMELYHGPTLAFKDFGARFLAGLMGHFAESQGREIVVLVATSGDTGSAVANGFLNVPGVRVIILYPSGKVSPLQEKQLTTLGGNITAWEVQGTFDDCQRMVKQLFMDADLRKKYLLTSANSINLARLIPQSFYYFHGWGQLSGFNKPVVVSVPSGNFGNLTAGILARRLGLPVSRFIASTNVNDVVPAYLASKVFNPQPSKQTISNAMDVGDPSNFARLMDLYENVHASVKKDIIGYSFTDDQTRDIMRTVFRNHSYMLDPHGAVGYLGLKKYLSESGSDANGLFLETAHPGKFSEVVEETLEMKLQLPLALESLKSKKKDSLLMSNKVEDAKTALAGIMK
ncbi:MAG TPA: threonine synthase [Cyclobacteriaceae bacterium]|nr:threonine synthase [Cyclobacteriaceae bacterium]